MLPSSEPLVSIVMPVYNRSYCIGDAVRSCIDQNYKNWELIIVDDGSDDSEQLVRKLQRFDDERIRYFRLDHSGNISFLRNFGNSKAKGDYIVVHDSDDMAYPNRLKVVMDTFTSTNTDVAYHGMYIRALDVDNNAVARVHKPSEPFDKSRLLKEQYIMGQIAYKKAVWEQIPYDETFALMDDWSFLIDLAMAGKTFKQIDRDVYELVSLKDSININGEEDGRRSRDTELLVKKLKDKYGIVATAEVTRFILPAKP